MMLNAVRCRLRQTLMEDSRRALVSLQRRLKFLSQQQFIFVSSLDRCRRQNFEPTKPISTISQIQAYKDEVTDNATDKRIFAIFLSLVYDLDEFRRYLEKLTGQCVDQKLQRIFRVWKKYLHPRQDISKIRARFPNDQINHLSCDEARNHFGGVVSLIPFAMDCAKEAVERLEASESSFDITPPNFRASQEVSSAKFQARVRPHSSKSPRTSFREETSPESGERRIATPIPQQRPASSAASRSTHSTISRPSSQSSVRPNSIKGRRPASAHPTSYASQAVQTLHSRGGDQRDMSGKAVQTPKYLQSTLKPSLKWAHQTVSEGVMRKFMNTGRRHAFSKPGWKP